MAQSSRVVIHRAGVSGHHVSMDRFDAKTAPFFQEQAITEFIKITLFFESNIQYLFTNANYFYFFNNELTQETQYAYLNSVYANLTKEYIIEPSEMPELLDNTTVTVINTPAVQLTQRVFRLSNVVVVNVPLFRQSSTSDGLVERFKVIHESAIDL